MARDWMSTSQIARAAGVHPNTIRLYESWGFLSPVQREGNGYRRFYPVHLDQVRLVQEAHHCTWVSGAVRRTGLDLIARFAAEDWQTACATAEHLLQLVQAERRQAEAAADYLEQWARGLPPPAISRPLRIGEVAQLLDVTIDSLRNWERNGLISVPHDPANRYRQYGPLEIGRLRIIRLLIRSKYSVMAILRVLTRFDQGATTDLRATLNTPQPDEDVFYFADAWLTTLTDMETHARRAIEIVSKHAAPSA